MVNTEDSAVAPQVSAMLDSFPTAFRQRVHVDVSTLMHRVVPLNRALEMAAGTYLAVLDDDDLVFADWVEEFHEAARTSPGAVARCRAVDQQVDVVAGTTQAAATSGFSTPYRARFDFASHLLSGQSPLSTLCFPLDAVDEFGLRFDEDIVVCEDLEFSLRVAMVCGVADTETFGVVYRRWESEFSSGHTVSPEVWEASMRTIVERLDAAPLLLPEGSASRLFQAAAQERQVHELSTGTAALLRRVEVAEHNWASLAHAYKELQADRDNIAADRDRLRDLAATPDETPPLRRIIRHLRP
jgi:hypothetical protein